MDVYVKHPVRCERDVPATCVCCDSRVILIAYADGYWGSCSWFGKVRVGVVVYTAAGMQQAQHARLLPHSMLGVLRSSAVVCYNAAAVALDNATLMGCGLCSRWFACVPFVPVLLLQMHPDLYDISPDGLSDEEDTLQQQQQPYQQQQEEQLSRRAAMHVHYCEPSRLLGVVFADGSAALFSPAGASQLQAQLVFRRWLCTAAAG